MARVLGIGTATLDIINDVDGYPKEDSEVRAVAQRRCCGGNAVNTLMVLRLLGHHCVFGGVLSNDPNGDLICQDLERRGIELDASRMYDGGKTPTSYICLNIRNGSRTIVHYRELPEYRYEDFSRVDLSGFDWLHFEGRCVEDTRAMLDKVRIKRPGLSVSVEIEKPRVGIDALFQGPRLLFFSQVFAKARGYADPLIFLREVSRDIPNADLVCALGSAGAMAIGRDGKEHFSPAFVPHRVVDTLGAGDAFHAGLIDARMRGMDLNRSLVAATKLAGKKCGFVGFDHLRKLS